MSRYQKTRLWRGPPLRVLLSLVLAVVVLSACGSAEQRWQQQYDLGLRFLEECRYEDAILAFTAAIEIDPKQAPAYVGRGDAMFQMAKATAGDAADPAQLSEEAREAYENAIADYKEAIRLDAALTDCYRRASEVYLVLGQEEEAAAILQEGHETTGDEALLTLLQEILGEDEPAQTPKETPEANRDQDSGQIPEQEQGQGTEQLPDQTVGQDQEPEQPPEQPEEPEPEPVPEPQLPAADAAEMYTAYIQNGGLQENEWIPDTIQIDSSCLVDIDEDGEKELFVHGEDEFGSRYDALLDQENGEVVIRHSAVDYVNGAGESLSMLYDTQEQKHVLGMSYYDSDGENGSESYCSIFDQSLENEIYNIHIYWYDLYDPFYQNEIDKIKGETNYYKTDDWNLIVYKLNGQYISEEEYNAWMARFQPTTDPAYQLKPATNSQPVAP